MLLLDHRRTDETSQRPPAVQPCPTSHSLETIRATMCQTTTTHLTCGHVKQGPVMQCDAAASTAPRASHRDDGGNALCRSPRIIDTQAAACCDQCVTQFFRQILLSICQRCRRGVIYWAAQAALRSSSTPTSASESSGSSPTRSHSPAGSDNSYSHW